MAGQYQDKKDTIPGTLSTFQYWFLFEKYPMQRAKFLNVLRDGITKVRTALRIILDNHGASYYRHQIEIVLGRNNDITDHEY
uniref:AlNc14C62G4509 protein n=1 Tax=Albugo laibachii Nc14 TaxID=890382 RepID=F0WCY4_9STRA|nr:AlNc14C62G4509 [Albugo laibachii Nc14]|eukprot:CCA19055.1 AlNc14C62G4509 [Albugo laibachii Nc14]